MSYSVLFVFSWLPYPSNFLCCLALWIFFSLFLCKYKNYLAGFPSCSTRLLAKLLTSTLLTLNKCFKCTVIKSTQQTVSFKWDIEKLKTSASIPVYLKSLLSDWTFITTSQYLDFKCISMVLYLFPTWYLILPFAALIWFRKIHKVGKQVCFPVLILRMRYEDCISTLQTYLNQLYDVLQSESLWR